jgi:hypothetical protein
MRLLPYAFKIPDFVLVAAGLATFIWWLRFDLRITAPVFALVSQYTGTRWLTIFQTKIADEVILLCLLTGFAFLVFSKEKNERSFDAQLRMESMFKAARVQLIITAGAVFFLYGTAFTAFLLINLCALPVIYLIIFYLKRYRSQREAKAV